MLEAPDRYMRWAFLLAIWVAAEVGGYYGLRRLGLWRRWMGWSTLGVFLGLAGLYSVGYLFREQIGQAGVLWVQRIGGLVFLGWLALVLGKLLGGLFGLIVPARRASKAVLASIPAPGGPQEAADFSAGRRATLQIIGGAMSSLPAMGLGYGFWVGRYRFQLYEVEAALPDLPAAWEGARILQLSDLHSGSFVSPEVLEPVWELITRAAPDLLVFTGDWVNTYGWELEPFVRPLSQLQAPLGKWAVLGNHDYGDYARWPTPAHRQKDHQHLRQLIAEAGFRLLDNQSVLLERAGSSLALMGVGNWSAWRRFHRYGDLAKAWEAVPVGTCAILLSHDPTHWSAQVQGRYPISLTLSGHTHGLQVGVEWASFRFSPAQWLYPHWAGLYEEAGQLLYVNRGLGYIGLPARLGIWPEVTLIALRRRPAP